ncbi:dicarboxylate/amino acid:cation symporter [Rariglobus hedericola]|uniref:C4-dicarboxylate transport protein n=1 Tax=Rariglobus hedericola TaxID=2597822 RepID=A0A556QP91_9BACT|nr:dicarboxylate/amino acid:cation symporter [Rariglobus hedericola]TSJ78451.1 dicarboxylate/amino acid:cation symporter [Rariglobus hedericola]
MKFFKHLYVQVLIAIALGIALGEFNPDLGAQMKPLGDAFIKLIKMLIGPIIFLTVVVGIAGMGDMKKLGRVGAKAMFYFEVVSTLALVIGMVVVNIVKPGEGINADVSTLDASAVASYTKAAAHQSTVEFLLHVIPNTFVSAFSEGEILQVLLVSVMFGFALSRLGDHARPVIVLLNEVSKAFFGMVSLVTKVAPIAAFGAMAFTIGKYGLGSLVSLGKLMLCVYITCAFFVFVVLGIIGRLHGFSVIRLLAHIKEEILIVLGTSSSESVLPRMMQKMEDIGCARPVVGIVLPAGYSFNLDGTSIYLTMAAIFVAQATNTPLTLTQELTILGVLLLTSKGAAGVTGSGFVTLAATLASVSHIPVAGLALLIGVDRFMSEARALTNLCGNAVAMVVVAMWEKAFDRNKGRAILLKPPAEEPAPTLT